MKIQTKLKILIALYTFLPILIMGVAVKDSPMFLHQDVQKALVIGVFGIVLVIMSGHLFGLPWLLTRQLKTVRAYCRNIRKGDYTPVSLPVEPDEPDDENELIALMRHMNWMVHQISRRESRLKRTLASLETTNQKLSAANAAIEKARKALWGEMALARKIQMALAPSSPELPGFRLDAKMRPAAEVGGDYYDVISVNGHHWVIIGDVSGHGVSAGLIMMMAQTAIHTALNDTPEICPSGLLTIINRSLTRNIRRLNESTYMTMTALKISEDGSIRFAGLHQDLLIYRAASQHVENIETCGMWLGLMEDISEVLPVGTCRLDKGDCLLLYTDGLTEIKDADGRMTGDDALIALLEKNGGETVHDISEKIMASFEHCKQEDDLTFLLMKYTCEEKKENEQTRHACQAYSHRPAYCEAAPGRG